MSDTVIEGAGEELKVLQEHAPNTQVAPGHGIAAIALSMAMKYHGMMMIPDGLTYQQYKMEGRNIREIGLSDVFETAIKIEMHLLAGSERIANLLIEALAVEVEPEGADETEEQVRRPSSAEPHTP